MSFLEEIQRKRFALQATATVVTTQTGAQYIESKTEDGTLVPIKLSNRTHGFVVDTKPDTVAASILDDFLYLGSQDAVSTTNIKMLKLTHILSVGIETPYVDDTKLTTKFLACLDVPETQLYEGIAQTAIDFIERARFQNGRVLVHCNAGVSRSASVVIAYLMSANKLSFETAYKLVKSKRECIQPNVGFMQQLKNQEMS